MQKVPILPTMPWQAGGFESSPFEEAGEAEVVEEQRLYLRSIMGVGLTLALFVGPVLAAIAQVSLLTLLMYREGGPDAVCTFTYDVDDGYVYSPDMDWTYSVTAGQTYAPDADYTYAPDEAYTYNPCADDQVMP